MSIPRKEDGLLDQLSLYEGKLLDGRERQRACDELGIKLNATHFRTFTGTRDEAFRFGIRLNLTTRRQVNYTQKVGMASNVANLGQGGGVTARSKLQSLGLTPVSMDEAAKLYGVSTSSISEFRKIKDSIFIARMMSGELSVWEARRIILNREEEVEKAEARRERKAKKKAATGTNGGGASLCHPDPPSPTPPRKL